MIEYPKSLKYPLLSSTSFQQQSNILRTEMGSGRARQRQLFDSVPTIMSATWKLPRRQAVIFEGFCTNDINVTEWFLMDIPTPRGLLQHQVRFTKSPFENYKLLGSGKWQYQAQIEIKTYQKPNEEEVIKQVLKPYSLEDFVNRVKAALNSYEG